MRNVTLRKLLLSVVVMILGSLPYYHFVWPGIRTIAQDSRFGYIVLFLFLVTIIVAFSGKVIGFSKPTNRDASENPGRDSPWTKYLAVFGMTCIFLPIATLLMTASNPANVPMHLSPLTFGEIEIFLTDIGVLLLIFRTNIAHKITFAR